LEQVDRVFTVLWSIRDPELQLSCKLCPQSAWGGEFGKQLLIACSTCEPGFRPLSNPAQQYDKFIAA